jgi:hypothetical protein
MMRTRSLRAGEHAALIATSVSMWTLALPCAHASLATSFRNSATLADDEFTSRRMLREIRDAELTSDLTKLASLRDVARASTSNEANTLAANALLLERIVLAERAMAMRNRTQSARELAQGEEALARERLALATRFPAAERRQLELESAEDLLLRRMRADLMDVALALGVPTDDEREAARRLSKLIAPIFATSRVEDSALDASRIATDPEIFREAMLGGIASLLAADVAATSNDSEGAAVARRSRDRAADLLAIAARSELPVPPALADALVIARARTKVAVPNDSNSADETRAITEKLEGIHRSKDPANALVARFLQDEIAAITANRTASLPKANALGNDLALDCIAACATADRRARELSRTAPRATDGVPASNTALIEQPIAALFARAIETPNSDRSAALTTLAAAARARITPAVIAAARSDSKAPPLLTALCAFRLTREGAEVTFEPKEIEQLDRAVADPRVTSWFAIPFAAALIRADAAYAPRATDHLLTLVANTAADERTREALAIALDQRRAEANTSLIGEAKLASALELAARVFAGDAARDAWLLEAVDLALFPKFGRTNLESAAQRLALVTHESSGRTLRALECAHECAHESGVAAKDRRSNLAAVEALDAALTRDISAGLADPSLRVRSSALFAATQLSNGDIAQAIASASRAISEAPTSLAASRAALTWIAAALKSESAIPLPSGLSSTMGAFPELQRVCDDAIDARFPTVEIAIVGAALAEVGAENDEKKLAQKSPADADARRVVLLATAMQNATTSLPSTLAAKRVAKHALALFASDATTDATALAREAFDRDPRDRFVAWATGEVLCGSNAAPDRAEGFAILRDLAPMTASMRDEFWWRAQARMLEVLAREAGTGDTRRASDVIARVNRLRTLDPALGGDATSQRIQHARDRAETLLKSNTSSTQNGVPHGG